MSDSKAALDRIGFSTGALERGNYRQALRWLRHHSVQHAELSALRFHELEPLIDDLDSLPLNSFTYISFHAPSAFPEDAEQPVVELLTRVFARNWNIIVHPDVIRLPSLWHRFGRRLLLENMDRRKEVARTADELDVYFSELPEARLCLDVAHARQLDTTLTVLSEIVYKFRNKLAEIHISELDSHCAHHLMSFTAVTDYRQLAAHFHSYLPIIIESSLQGVANEVRLNELLSAQSALRHLPQKHQWSKTYFWLRHHVTPPASRKRILKNQNGKSLAHLQQLKASKLLRLNHSN
jgi:hypothetical protein